LNCERKVLIFASPEKIEWSFKKWTAEDGLNEVRFKKALDAIGIGFEENVWKLFMNFRNGDKYDLKKVICFCVFLSCAQPERKAEVWFDVLDVQVKNQLSFAQVKAFIKLIFSFTFQILPNLAIGSLTSESLELYINTSLKSRKAFTAQYSQKLCPEPSLDKEIFKSQLQLFSKLTYSEGVRSLLHSVNFP
jgi:hypothetical protein